ncbi:hypothetical protein DH09_08445 [Bacillaceae bacterium JMAK1]|nr:hypothetical protein DH09_08445 [Bacillaceae bacterium JMAK1]
MRKSIGTLLLSAFLLTACGSDDEIIEEVSADQPESSDASENEERSRGIDDLFNKDLGDLEAQDWDSVYIAKRDFDLILKEMIESAEEHDLDIQDIKMVSDDHIEVIYNFTDEEAIMHGFILAFVDGLTRSLYLSSGYYNGEQPLISYYDLNGELIGELHDFADFNDEDISDVEETSNNVLTEVGDSIETDEGTITLKNIKNTQEPYNHGQLEITIEDIKVFERTEIPETYLSYAQDFSNQQLNDSYNYIQVAYSAKNNDESLINWRGFEKVVLSNGQQIDVSFDSYRDGREWGSEFYGGVIKDEHFSVIFDGSSEDIDLIKLVLSDSYDSDYRTVTDSTEIDYEM